jgi:aminomethyltransferase
VSEPDVSPLAVQGPKAAALIADLFGDWIHELKYFCFRDSSLQGIPLLLARSGWSKQGGFELYLRDGARGRELWDIVKAAGAAFDIGPGAPNDIERLESGLLSYGADARVQTQPANPFELGLGKLVDLDRDADFIGKQALLKVRAEGIKRRLSGFVIEGDPVPGSQHPVALMQHDARVGSISEMAWSPALQQNIGIGLVSNTVADDVANLTVAVDDIPRKASLTALPFIR